MTNLATKNGSLIVKDGKIAQDCGCCGGWYCYNHQCQCVTSGASSITTVDINITGQDWLLHNSYTAGGQQYYGSYLVQFSRLNGTISLSKTSPSSVWKYSAQGRLTNAGGCVYVPSQGGVDGSFSGNATGYGLILSPYVSAYEDLQSSGHPHLNKGDTIPNTNIGFGVPSDQHSTLTYAVCAFFSVSCSENGWAWSVQFENGTQAIQFPYTWTMAAGGANRGALSYAFSSNSQVIDQQGAPQFTINSISINQSP